MCQLLAVSLGHCSVFAIYCNFFLVLLSSALPERASRWLAVSFHSREKNHVIKPDLLNAQQDPTLACRKLLIISFCKGSLTLHWHEYFPLAIFLMAYMTCYCDV